MKGKKFLVMILSAALGMSTFAACGSRVVESEKRPQKQRQRLRRKKRKTQKR